MIPMIFKDREIEDYSRKYDKLYSILGSFTTLSLFLEKMI
jgi:hypothetical protein